LNQGRNLTGATSSCLREYSVPSEEGTEGAGGEQAALLPEKWPDSVSKGLLSINELMM